MSAPTRRRTGVPGVIDVQKAHGIASGVDDDCGVDTRERGPREGLGDLGGPLDQCAVTGNLADEPSRAPGAGNVLDVLPVERADDVAGTVDDRQRAALGGARQQARGFLDGELRGDRHDGAGHHLFDAQRAGRAALVSITAGGR